MAFGRVCELFIGVFKDGNNTQDGYLIDGESLHFEFDIKRSTEFYKDTAIFTIYNPNEETRQQIMTAGCAVIFRAGYKDETIGNIFIGQIADAYPEDEGPENTKLILVCNSQRGAQYPLQRTYITAYIGEDKTYYDVLKTIADYVGIPVSGAEVLKSHKLADDGAGYIINGNVRDAVTNFVSSKLRSIGGKVVISNNELVYIDHDSVAHFETAYLTYNSGLISAKARRDEKFQSSEDAFEENREYYLGLKSQGDKEVAKEKLAKAEIQPRNEIEFECYVNPGIQVGTPIYVDARVNSDDRLSVVGKFYVNELNCVGDNFGGNFMMSGRAVEK